MNLNITYWQAAKYRMTVDASVVLEALADYISAPFDPPALVPAVRVAKKIRDGHPLDTYDLNIVETVLNWDGQLVTSENPVDYGTPSDYGVTLTST